MEPTPIGVFGTKSMWDFYHDMLKQLQDLPEYKMDERLSAYGCTIHQCTLTHNLLVRLR